MFGLFKKKPTPKETLFKLQLRVKSLEQQVSKYNKEAKEYDKKADKAIKKNDMDEARLMLKLKIQKENEAKQIRTCAFNLKEICSNLDSKLRQKDLVNGIQQALNAINIIDDSINVENTTELMDTLMRTLNDQDIEITFMNERMSEKSNTSINDDEITRQMELKKMQINAQQQQMPASYAPIGTQQSVGTQQSMGTQQPVPVSQSNTDFYADFNRRYQNL